MSPGLGETDLHLTSDHLPHTSSLYKLGLLGLPIQLTFTI